MKIVCGLFKWDDGVVTAAALRDDMFDQAGVELLVEIFFLPEAFDLADAWNTSVKRIQFVTQDQLHSVGPSLYGYQVIGNNVIRVRPAVDEAFVYYVAVK